MSDLATTPQPMNFDTRETVNLCLNIEKCYLATRKIVFFCVRYERNQLGDGVTPAAAPLRVPDMIEMSVKLKDWVEENQMVAQWNAGATEANEITFDEIDFDQVAQELYEFFVSNEDI